jgi:hypothetical protein
MQLCGYAPLGVRRAWLAWFADAVQWLQCMPLGVLMDRQHTGSPLSLWTSQKCDATWTVSWQALNICLHSSCCGDMSYLLQDARAELA